MQSSNATEMTAGFPSALWPANSHAPCVSRTHKLPNRLYQCRKSQCDLCTTIQCRRQKGETLHKHTCNRLTLELGLSISTQRCASVCCCLFSHSVAPSNDIPLLSSALVSASASLHASLYQPHRCAERDTKENITSVSHYYSSTKSTNS